jgi:hypothetical protein
LALEEEEADEDDESTIFCSEMEKKKSKRVDFA